MLLSDAPAGRFDDSALDRDASDAIAALAVAVDGAADTLRAAARLLREKIEQQRGELSASAWRLAVQDATQSYAGLVAALREEGVSDPNEYGHLARDRQLLDDGPIGFAGGRARSVGGGVANIARESARCTPCRHCGAVRVLSRDACAKHLRSHRYLRLRQRCAQHGALLARSPANARSL